MMQETVQGMINDFVRDLKNDKYFMTFLGVALVVLLAVGGWKAKQWYFESKEGASQLMFSEALDEYDRALFESQKGTQKKQQWDDAAFGFKTVQEKDSGTTYATYAQAFGADVKAREGNFKEAIESLEQAITTMGQSAPGYYLFKTKVALLKLDAGQTDQGLDELKTLADNSVNQNSDTAAFFLGYYYWSKDKFSAAQKAWSRFEKSKQPTDSQKVSPWAQIAQIKLSQIA